MLAPGRQFYLDQGTLHTGYAWGALHYITLRNRKWAGMDKITQYQRLIRIGTPREEAFTEAFGVTSAKMDVLIQKYLAKDRFKTVNLAPMKEIPDSKIVVKRAEPGQWELGQARLVTQQGPLDSALAQRLLDKAQELRPDDPAVYETLWLYKAKSGEAAAAFEYLLKARELGSENHAVRLQWSIDLINQNIAKTRGFIIPDKDAAQAADDLMQMEAAIPGRLLVYRLHAQMITSLTQPRTQDREFIENAIAMVHTADPVLETGLAAWYWRNGQMDKANAHLTKSNYEVNDVQFIRFFGDWVRSQIEAQQSLDEIDGVLRDRDYETVKELYGYIPRNYALTPALKERTEAIATELKQFDFLMTIQERLDAGEKEAARLLIQSMDGLEMSENLEKIGEDLRKRL